MNRIPYLHRLIVTLAAALLPADAFGASTPLAGIVKMTTGGENVCALHGDGTASCWGIGRPGTNGDGVFAGDRRWATPVPGVSDLVDIAVGSNDACGVRANGEVLCWGWSTGSSGRPALVPGVSGASRIASGWVGACMVVTGGVVKCWGGGTVLRTSAFSGAGEVAVGTLNSCALLGDGGVRCWPQLDVGNAVTMPLPPATSIAAGYSTMCATFANAAVRCWGDDNQNPTEVPGTEGAIAVAGGAGHACALKADGSVLCWGSNGSGQLGDGTQVDRAEPAPVPGVSATALWGGFSGTSCVLQGDVPLCWGGNLFGQLANGGVGSFSAVPVAPHKFDRRPSSTPLASFFPTTTPFYEGVLMAVMAEETRNGAVEFHVEGTTANGAPYNTVFSRIANLTFTPQPGKLAWLHWQLLPAGTYTVIARYLGDDENLPSESTPWTQTILPLLLQIAPPASLPPRAVDDPVQVVQVTSSARLAPNVTSGSPSVCTVERGDSQAEASVPTAMAFSYRVTLTGAGSCRLSASHPGDNNFRPAPEVLFGFYVDGAGANPSADSDGDGIPDSREYAEGRNLFAKDNDVFASARLFAMQQYRDFLGREGDSGGITYYTERIDSAAATRTQVVEAFLASPEFQAGLPQVTRLYFSFFNRIPDYPGLLFQVGEYRRGVALAVIAENFANAPEFMSRYGPLNDEQFVDLVYQNVLARAPDPEGRAYYLERLGNGALTRGAMMAGFSESPEFQALSGIDVFVAAVYVGLLRRSPEDAGLAYYANLLEQGLARGEMIGSFLASQEYRGRFLP